MQLQITAATWRIQTTGDSAFYQITLVLVLFFVVFISNSANTIIRRLIMQTNWEETN